jgi:ABC-type lipoprotein release transport system permease subunit
MKMRRNGKSIAVELDRPRVSVALVLAALVAAMNVSSTIVMLVMAR